MINTEKTENTIIKLLESVSRPGMTTLIEWLKSTDFFEAPASSIYHLNVKGGLAHHSLSVYDTLCKFNHMITPKQLTVDSEIITGLLHDVCKIGIYKWFHDEHLKNPSDRHDNTIIRREGYIRDDPFPVGHGDKSVILLQKHIELTNQEIALIRWHMGPYDSEFNRGQKHIKKAFPEVKLLYLADDFSTQFLEEIE